MINNPVIRTAAAEPGWKSPPVSPPPPSEGIARWGRGVGGSPREALTLEGAHFLKGVLQSPAGSVGMAIWHKLLEITQIRKKVLVNFSQPTWVFTLIQALSHMFWQKVDKACTRKPSVFVSVMDVSAVHCEMILHLSSWDCKALETCLWSWRSSFIFFSCQMSWKDLIANFLGFEGYSLCGNYSSTAVPQNQLRKPEANSWGRALANLVSGHWKRNFLRRHTSFCRALLYCTSPITLCVCVPTNWSFATALHFQIDG